MKVIFLTIVLDGMPWIGHHYTTFRSLPFPWEWHIVEGVAAPVNCTAWCKRIPPRLSDDGTTEYLRSLAFDKRVNVYRKPLWQGKIEMVNAPLPNIGMPGLLWQVDSDEIWTAAQISRMRSMFLADPTRTSAQFYCRYFLGPDIVTTKTGTYGNREFDWLRVWRYAPGMRFATHEPPVLVNLDGVRPGGSRFTQAETAAAGLVFDHFAYTTSATVEFKQKYYGAKGGKYAHAVRDWQRLQANTKWPARLVDYLPWVDDKAEATRL